MTKQILVSSGYGANTRKPFVMMEAEALDRPIQLSTTEARELGANLLQAAEAAEGDENVVKFATEKLGLSLQEAAGLLVQFRELRNKNRK